MSRAAPFLPLLLAFAGCTGDPTPGPLPEVTRAASRVDGAWTWSVQGLACPGQAGLLSPADGSEVFPVDQEGDRLRASFRDRAGNDVALEGTVRNGVVEATFVVRAPAAPPAPLSHDRPICDGKAYLVSASDDALYVFDLRLGAVLAVVPFPGGDPTRPCTDPAGTTLFVPLPGTDAVALLATESDRVFATLQGPEIDRPVACAVSPDGRALFVAGATGSLAEAEIATRTIRGSIALSGTGTSDLCWGPDGETLFAVHHDTSTLDLVDARTGVLRAAGVPTSQGPVSAALARRSDGTATLLVVGDAGLDLFDPVTLGRTTLPLAGFDVAVTPDGGTAYLSRTAGPDFATALDLSTLQGAAAFRGSVSRGFGIALCGDGGVPLLALGDAYPAVILDPLVGAVFDNFALGGEFLATVGGGATTTRETVFTLEGRAEGVGSARQVSGTLRILRDTSPLAAGCVGSVLPWSATIR